MKHDRHGMLANMLQWPARHPHHRLLDLDALRLQRIDDVRVGDRAEEAPVDAGLLDDAQRRALELFALRLRRDELLRSRLLELGASRLDRLQILGRRALGLAVRDQEVSRVAVAHLDDVAQVADVRDFFEQDDLHGGPRQCRSVYDTSARKRARLIAVPSWRW